MQSGRLDIKRREPGIYLQVMAIMTYSKGNSCMGIRYAKLFEAAKSLFKS